MERKININEWENLLINMKGPPTHFDQYEWNYLRYEIMEISGRMHLEGILTNIHL